MLQAGRPVHVQRVGMLNPRALVERVGEANYCEFHYYTMEYEVRPACRSGCKGQLP